MTYSVYLADCPTPDAILCIAGYPTPNVLLHIRRVPYFIYILYGARLCIKTLLQLMHIDVVFIYFSLWTTFMTSFSVPIVEFKQVNAGWVSTAHFKNLIWPLNISAKLYLLTRSKLQVTYKECWNIVNSMNCFQKYVTKKKVNCHQMLL